MTTIYVYHFIIDFLSKNSKLISFFPFPRDNMKSSNHDIQSNKNGNNIKNSQIKKIYNYFCKVHEPITDLTSEEKEMIQKLRTLPKDLQKTILTKITVLNKLCLMEMNFNAVEEIKNRININLSILLKIKQIFYKDLKNQQIDISQFHI